MDTASIVGHISCQGLILVTHLKRLADILSRCIIHAVDSQLLQAHVSLNVWTHDEFACLTWIQPRYKPPDHIETLGGQVPLHHVPRFAFQQLRWIRVSHFSDEQGSDIVTKE